MLRRRRIAITFVGLVFHVVILPGRIGLTPEVQTIFQQLQRQLQLQLLVQRPSCMWLRVRQECHAEREALLRSVREPRLQSGLNQPTQVQRRLDLGGSPSGSPESV